MLCMNCNEREAGAYTEGGIKTALCSACFAGQFETQNILLVSEQGREAIRHWPDELRSLFDPDADRKLAERIAAEKARPAASGDLPDPLPF